MKLKKALKSKNYYRQKLTRNAVGHFMINIGFNKDNILAIIDSGASNTVFDKTWLEQRGHKLSLTEANGGGVGSSQVEIFSTNTKVKIKIGEMKIRSENAYAMDFNHINTALNANNIEEIHCIIGADYLKKYHAIIDYKKEQLFLKRRKK